VDLLVELDRWSYDCCGERLERGDNVIFRCIPTHHGNSGDDVRSGAEFIRNDHADVAPVFLCAGTVIDLSVFVPATGQRQQIQHLPSGRASRGFDPTDDGSIYALDRGEPLMLTGPRRYLVTLGSVTISDQPQMSD
jgi:hypothetical protein